MIEYMFGDSIEQMKKDREESLEKALSKLIIKSRE